MSRDLTCHGTQKFLLSVPLYCFGLTVEEVMPMKTEVRAAPWKY
jgi:hypothetical protein